MMRPGPRPNVATLASGRGWRLVLVEPDTRVLPGWRRYWPTDRTFQLVLAPTGLIGRAASIMGATGVMLDALPRGIAALRALGHTRRVLALEVRDASADVRRVRKKRP